jgi:hypothetical protein
MGDHVFVCYSRKDEDFVVKLAENLKDQGVPIWLDQWDIPSGVNWPRAIDKALSDCARLLVVLSPSSVESDEVQSEWYAALDEKKVVVPILYRPCRIPFRLKPIQYIDFTSRIPDDKEAIGQILNALGIAKASHAIAEPAHEPENPSVHKWVNYDEAIQQAYDRQPDRSSEPKSKPVKISAGAIALIVLIGLLILMTYGLTHRLLL